MSDSSAPLWLHAYAGRENGLMVVGNRASIKALGLRLVAAADAEIASSSVPGWPDEIAHPEVVGPYKDIPDFSLSFHLEGVSPAAEVLPMRRRGLPTPLFIAVAVCTAVGLSTIGRWVLAFVL